MCGISAIPEPDSRIREDAVDRALANRRHWGPGICRIWRDEQAGIVPGHARLSQAWLVDHFQQQ